MQPIATKLKLAAGSHRITLTNFKHMYWTFAQMLTHHASNGCNLMPGDIIASGTTSGPSEESRACLAEITSRGSNPITLSNGEMRGWLEDGDEVIFRARAEREGFTPIGYGECRGVIGPAVDWPTPYLFKDPVVLPKGTELSATAYYVDKGGGIRVTVSGYRKAGSLPQSETKR